LIARSFLKNVFVINYMQIILLYFYVKTFSFVVEIMSIPFRRNMEPIGGKITGKHIINIIQGGGQYCRKRLYCRI
jgi:hypothetical protein